MREEEGVENRSKCLFCQMMTPYRKIAIFPKGLMTTPIHALRSNFSQSTEKWVKEALSPKKLAKHRPYTFILSHFAHVELSAPEVSMNVPAVKQYIY